jgi:hypothetical protein
VLDLPANGTDEYILQNAEWEVTTVSNASGTGIVAGGLFLLGNQVTIRTNASGAGIISVVASGVVVRFNEATPAQATIYGNINYSGGYFGAANNTCVVNNASTGTLNIYGNIS